MDSLFGDAPKFASAFAATGAFASSSLWGKFGGLHACEGTFSSILALPNIFLSRLFSKTGLKRKDFQKIAQLAWAQEVILLTISWGLFPLISVLFARRCISLSGSSSFATPLKVPIPTVQAGCPGPTAGDSAASFLSGREYRL
jgi:hypothetical protein